MNVGLTACIALLTIVMSASAAPITWDSEAANTLYNLPPGWTAAQKDGATTLTPPDVPNGEKVVIVMAAGRKLEDEFRKTFLQELDAAHADARHAGSPIQGTRADEGYDVLYCNETVTDASGKPQFRWLMASHPGDQFEMVMYAASTAALYRKYQGDFDDFIRTLSYKNVQPGPVQLSPRATKRAVDPARDIEGLYVANRSRQQLNMATNTYEARTWIDQYLFLPDGRVYHGFPAAGVVGGLDYDQARRDSPEKCGKYRVDGATITLDWPARPGFEAGKPEPFERNDAGITIGKQQYRRVTFEKDLKLDGTYLASSRDNPSAGANTGNVGGERKIVFKKDGTFEKSGFAGGSAGGSAVGAAAGANLGKGSYRIDDGVLELSDPSQAREQFSFYRFPGEELKVIVIDGVRFLRTD